MTAPGTGAVASVAWLPLRLHPGDDLRSALQAAVAAHGGGGAHVVSGIGSLDGARFRLAGAPDAIELTGDLELLSLSGTVASNGVHLHAVVSDAQGRVTGGHVAAGCTVRTTAEVLLALLSGVSLQRRPDPATGFDELVVTPSPSVV